LLIGVKCPCVRIRQITRVGVEPGECPGHAVVIALRMVRMQESVTGAWVVRCTGDAAHVVLSMASCTLWHVIQMEAYVRVI
jgi:hypothetical protein